MYDVLCLNLRTQHLHPTRTQTRAHTHTAHAKNLIDWLRIVSPIIFARVYNGFAFKVRVSGPAEGVSCSALPECECVPYYSSQGSLYYVCAALVAAAEVLLVTVDKRDLE